MQSSDQLKDVGKIRVNTSKEHEDRRVAAIRNIKNTALLPGKNPKIAVAVERCVNIVSCHMKRLNL